MTVHCPSSEAWESTFYCPCDKLPAIHTHTIPQKNMPRKDKQNLCTQFWTNMSPVSVLLMTPLKAILPLIGSVFLFWMQTFLYPPPMCAYLLILPLQIAENVINLTDSQTTLCTQKCWMSSLSSRICCWQCNICLWRSTHCQDLPLGENGFGLFTKYALCAVGLLAIVINDSN